MCGVAKDDYAEEEGSINRDSNEMKRDNDVADCEDPKQRQTEVEDQLLC